jgi:hypothetical protein
MKFGIEIGEIRNNIDFMTDCAAQGLIKNVILIMIRFILTRVRFRLYFESQGIEFKILQCTLH